MRTQALCLQSPTLKIQLKMDFMEIFHKSNQNYYFIDVSGGKGFLSRFLPKHSVCLFLVLLSFIHHSFVPLHV